MCFRPPEAGLGEKVCPGCYLVIAPNPDGTCPECGAQMLKPEETASSSGASATPGAPKPPKSPNTPN